MDDFEDRNSLPASQREFPFKALQSLSYLRKVVLDVNGFDGGLGASCGLLAAHSSLIWPLFFFTLPSASAIS
jgi:hypothetical protein